ncbi:hypothetical protein BOA8489_01951 [Boseongicola aestuarii]|uniref:Uncharacterized protein n=1 Tax=Boseongicola aestuarii TaxID=1470561 RepID=A0A238IZC5_9RHOB|nr:hypothetical protein BOA8489_01951 [Boseongicola aestuarii]
MTGSRGAVVERIREEGRAALDASTMGSGTWKAQ